MKPIPPVMVKWYALWFCIVAAVAGVVLLVVGLLHKYAH